MTLYYSLVFAILVAEMTLFMLLIVPLPHTWKRKLFTFISESPLIAKLQYGMKITFIFILILFVDSVNRVYTIQLETAQAKSSSNGAAAVVGHERSELQSRKFYSQRNMYLCGFTLFLSLILNRYYVMILDTLRMEEKVKRLEGDPKASGKSSAKLDEAGSAGEIGRLKNEISKRDKNIEALKRQMEGLQREYGVMGDKVSAADNTPKKDR
ncbi:hypothetical protein MMC10_008251 [Thelotrema lepadinum]|nr:hypothetical protein [Thelotrema lepadinum]